MKTLLGVRGVGVGVTEDNVTDDLDDGDDNNDWVVAKEPTDVEFPGVGGSDGKGSDDEEEATNDEFPGFGGSDGNGSDDKEEATDDELPSVGGSDGYGCDDGSCSRLRTRGN